MEPNREMISSLEDLDIFVDRKTLFDPEQVDQRLKIVCMAITKMTLFNGGVQLSDILCEDIHACCVSLYDPRPYKNRVNQLVRSLVDNLENMVESKILPRLQEQADEEQLLSALVLMWNEYKRVVQSLSLVWDPVSDAYFNSNGSALNLKDLSVDIFNDLVCKDMYMTFVDAAVNMISRERRGDEINGDLIKSSIDFLVELRYRDEMLYDYLELNLQLEFHWCYWWLSLEWIDDKISFTSYLEKVEDCINREQLRMRDRVLPTTMEKLVEAVRVSLVDDRARDIVGLFFGF